MGVDTVRRDMKLAEKLVSNNWNMILSSISSLAKGSNIRPFISHQIFEFRCNAANKEIVVEVKPIVFKVPERAPKHPKIYICVKGCLKFDSPFLVNQRPTTKAFGTSVGYFREHVDYLEHVYGVHYDLDKCNFGHPIFHAQMKPMMDFTKDIEKHFDDKRIVCNKVRSILRTVRTPSAEMDIFSVFAQIIADHLIYDGSENEAKNIFINTLNSCNFFDGVAEKLVSFNRARATSRYRSPCWYSGFKP